MPEGGEPFYSAFWWLHRRRVYDMNGNPGGIGAGEITAYCHATGLDLEDAMYFVDLLDVTWRNWAHEAQEKRRKKTEKKDAKKVKPPPEDSE